MADTAGLPDLRDLKEKLEKAGGEVAAREFAARKAMAQRVVATAQHMVGGGPYRRIVQSAAESLRVQTYKDIVRVRLGDTTVVKGYPKLVWQKPANFGAYHDQRRRPKNRTGTARTKSGAPRAQPASILGWNMFPQFVKGEDVFLYRSIRKEAPALFEEYKTLFRSLF